MANGEVLELAVVRMHWALLPGDAGLLTLRLETDLAAPWPAHAAVRLDYRDLRRPDEIGWKEVLVAVGGGVRLIATDAPQTSTSGKLTAYPAPGTMVTPNVLAATVEAAMTPADAAAVPARRVDAGHRIDAPQRTGETPSARSACHCSRSTCGGRARRPVRSARR